MARKIRNDKSKNLKCAFFYRKDPSQTYFFVGFLTEDYNYTEAIVRYKKTWCVAFQTRFTERLMSKYYLTARSEIVMTDGFTRTEPVSRFINAIYRQLPFKMLHIKKVRVLQRIAHYHKNLLGKRRRLHTIEMFDADRIWAKLVEKECCPWITSDPKLQPGFRHYDMNKLKYEKVRRFLRMGVYYILIKQDLAYKSEMSRLKRLARNEVQPDTMSIEQVNES